MTHIYPVFRGLKHDWQAGGLPVIALALTVAVCAVTSVGVFNDRVWRAMQGRAAETLGADLVIQSHDRMPSKIRNQAMALGLAVSQQIEFSSMILTDSGIPRLVSVKAIDEHYPLRGTLQTSGRLFAPAETADTLPAPGELWAHARLFAEVGISVNDEARLGEQRFRVTRVLVQEPDGFASFFAMAAPRVLMRLTDLAATGLISSTSHAHYRLQVAGAADDLDEFSRWLDAEGSEGLERRTVKNAQPAVRTALDRASSYLGLASLSVLIVAGAGIFLAALFYAREQSSAAAVMRCLGASHRRILGTFVFRMALVAFVASLLGALLGYIGQTYLASLAESRLGFALPSATIWPLATGVAVGLIAATGFGLAPLLKLPKVSVLGLLRQEQTVAPPSAWLSIGLVFLTTGGLVLWEAKDPVLALWVLGLTIALVIGLSVAGWAALRAIGQIRLSSPTKRYVLSSLARRAGTGTVQVLAFGLGITALLMVTVMRSDLLESWMGSIPPGTPNRFLINIQPGEEEAVNEFLTAEKLSSRGMFPMTRGRWIRHNGRDVNTGAYTTGRASGERATRGFNLTSTAALPSGNRVVEGSWWMQEQYGEKLLSLERDFASELGIRLGDDLTFSIAGTEVTGRVVNLREVAWDSFEVNFFVIASPGLLEGQPRTYITSFFMPPGNTQTPGRLLERFPSVTMFDVEALLRQVRSIIRQVSVAVQYVFLFTLLAGVATLIAAVQGGAVERSRDAAVLRALGSSTRRLWLVQFCEYTLLGGIAGLLAAGCSVLSASILASEVFGFVLTPGWSVWVFGFAGGAVGIGTVGALVIVGVVRRAPLRSLAR